MIMLAWVPWGLKGTLETLGPMWCEHYDIGLLSHPRSASSDSVETITISNQTMERSGTSR